MTVLGNLTTEIFVDSASPSAVKHAIERFGVSGVTTNPSLFREAGATNYLHHAKELVQVAGRNPVSIKLLADKPAHMEKEAQSLTGLGEHVWVKIPICSVSGDSNVPTIVELLNQGIKVNVTGIVDVDYAIREFERAIWPRATRRLLWSVLAGRIFDTGEDACNSFSRIRALATEVGAETLWASSRTVYDFLRATDVGASIITASPELIAKSTRLDLSPWELQLLTLKDFLDDADACGYSLLT